MKRLFTFGCSFTNWIWPTWADIYATQFDFFENWGMPSAGNLYIFNSIVEANNKHKFTPDDTIVIMWSGILRNDYYTQRWTFDKENISIRGSEIINFAYINAIDEWFKSKQLNYSFLSMAPYIKQGDLYEFYKETLDKIQPLIYHAKKRCINIDCNNLESYVGYHQYVREWYEQLRGPSWPPFKEYISQYPNLKIDKQMEIINNEIKDLQKVYSDDMHPSPIDYLENLQRWFNFVPDQKIITWVHEYDKLIMQSKYITYASNMPKEKIK